MFFGFMQLLVQNLKLFADRVVPVVQAYCYTKYLGHLELHFDSEGELLTPVKGAGVSFAEPKLLDGSIEQDPEILEALEEFRGDLGPYQREIGFSDVDLKRRGSNECNIGNMVTDAVRTCYWNDTTIAFENNGGIR